MKASSHRKRHPPPGPCGIWWQTHQAITKRNNKKRTDRDDHDDDNNEVDDDVVDMNKSSINHGPAHDGSHQSSSSRRQRRRRRRSSRSGTDTASVMSPSAMTGTTTTTGGTTTTTTDDVSISPAWIAMQQSLNIITPYLPTWTIGQPKRRYDILRPYLPSNIVLLWEVLRGDYDLKLPVKSSSISNGMNNVQQQGEQGQELSLLVIVESVESSVHHNIWTVTLKDETGITIRAWMEPRFIQAQQQKSVESTTTTSSSWVRPGVVWQLQNGVSMIIAVPEDNDDGIGGSAALGPTTSIRHHQERSLERVLLISGKHIVRVWTPEQQQDSSSSNQPQQHHQHNNIIAVNEDDDSPQAQRMYLDWMEQRKAISLNCDNDDENDIDDYPHSDDDDVDYHHRRDGRHGDDNDDVVDDDDEEEDRTLKTGTTDNNETIYHDDNYRENNHTEEVVEDNTSVDQDEQRQQRHCQKGNDDFDHDGKHHLVVQQLQRQRMGSSSASTSTAGTAVTAATCTITRPLEQRNRFNTGTNDVINDGESTTRSKPPNPYSQFRHSQQVDHETIRGVSTGRYGRSPRQTSSFTMGTNSATNHSQSLNRRDSGKFDIVDDNTNNDSETRGERSIDTTKSIAKKTTMSTSTIVAAAAVAALTAQPKFDSQSKANSTKRKTTTTTTTTVNLDVRLDPRESSTNAPGWNTTMDPSVQKMLEEELEDDGDDNNNEEVMMMMMTGKSTLASYTVFTNDNNSNVKAASRSVSENQHSSATAATTTTVSCIDDNNKTDNEGTKHNMGHKQIVVGNTKSAVITGETKTTSCVDMNVTSIPSSNGGGLFDPCNWAGMDLGGFSEDEDE